MVESKVYEEFENYRRTKIYNHLTFFSKYVSILGALVAFGISYVIQGCLTFGVISIITIYFSFYQISVLIIKNNYIKNFADYAGILIYLGTSYLICFYDLEINGKDGKKEFFAQRGTVQVTALISWLFVKILNMEFSVSFYNQLFIFISELKSKTEK